MKSITCVLLALSLSAFSEESLITQTPTQKTPAPAVQKAPPAPVDHYLQGEPLENKYCPAYNARAAFDVTPKSFKYRPSDTTSFFDASLIYWYAGEEGLTIASSGVLSSGTLYSAQTTDTLFQTSNYKVGFKIGCGAVVDQESVYRVDYTRYRGTNTTDSGANLAYTLPTAGVSIGTAENGTAVWAVNDWFLQKTAAGLALSGPAVSSLWKIGVDLLDFVASRPFYEARRITMSPSAGLRIALIRQSMIVKLTENASMLSNLATQPIGSRSHSNSWSIGPRVGLDSYCLLPMGFRFEGGLAGSLLFTSYTSIVHREDVASVSFNEGPYSVSYSNYNCLRPMAELGLGFGWGMYLSDRDFHIDFSADYDFMLFWSQNMMRKLLDDTLTRTSAASNELYLHGLTITGRFDF